MQVVVSLTYGALSQRHLLSAAEHPNKFPGLVTQGIAQPFRSKIRTNHQLARHKDKRTGVALPGVE